MELSGADCNRTGERSALADTPGPILLASLMGADSTLVAAQLSIPNRQKAEDIALMMDGDDALSLLEGVDDTWRSEGFAISERVLAAEVAGHDMTNVLKTALDRCTDELIATSGRCRDDRAGPRSWMQLPVIEQVSARTRSLMVETLFPVSPWHCPERVSIILNNQPGETLLRIGVDLFDRAKVSDDAGLEMARLLEEDDDYLKGPLSRVIGPAPSGVVDRLMQSRADFPFRHYWMHSASNWLVYAIDAYLAGGPGQVIETADGKRWWCYASRDRDAFAHALRCLSGPGVGQIAHKICLSGPLIPAERAFSILVHPGSEEIDALTFPESLASMADGVSNRETLP